MGIRIKAPKFLPDTLLKKQFNPTRFLSRKDVERFNREIKAGSKELPYEQKLRLLFGISNELEIATIAYYNGIIDTEYKLAIDLTPKTTDEYKAYNKVISEFLEQENNSIHWYNTALEHKTRIEKLIAQNPENKNEIIDRELNQIQEAFPETTEVLKDGYDLRFPYDDPHNRVSASNETSQIAIKEIYTYLRNPENDIYFGQFINWWHHLLILNIIEILKYKKFLQVEINNSNKEQEDIDVSDEEGHSGVEISDYFEEFYTILTKKVPKDDQKKLRLLLEGKKVGRKLLYTGTSSSLADAFGKMYSKNYVNAKNMKYLNHWINIYFKYMGDDNLPKEYSEAANYGILRGAENCKMPILQIDCTTGQIIAV